MANQFFRLAANKRRVRKKKHKPTQDQPLEESPYETSLVRESSLFAEPAALQPLLFFGRLPALLLSLLLALILRSCIPLLHELFKAISFLRVFFCSCELKLNAECLLQFAATNLSHRSTRANSHKNGRLPSIPLASGI